MNAKHDFEIIESEIHKFKSKIKTKYNQDVYVILKNIVNMSSLYDAIIITAEKHSPGSVKYLTDKSKTRLREVVDYLYCFYYICVKFKFTKTSIGKFIGRNHATIVHGVKTAENRLRFKDEKFLNIYINVRETIEKHVGPFPEDIRV